MLCGFVVVEDCPVGKFSLLCKTWEVLKAKESGRIFSGDCPRHFGIFPRGSDHCLV